MNKFSKSAAIQYGWDALKTNYQLLIGVVLVTWLFSFLGAALNAYLEKGAIATFLANLSFQILQIIFSIGLIKIFLKVHDGQKAAFSDLLNYAYLIFKYITGAFIYAIIVIFGFILLIVPGIIWAIKFQFFSYFIIDKEIGPIEALKRSAEITKGNKWNIFLFNLLIFLINIAGFMVFFVGGLVSAAITGMAMVYVYRELSKELKNKETSDKVVK